VPEIQVKPIEVRHGVNVNVAQIEEFLRERCELRVPIEEVEACVDEDMDELILVLIGEAP
jgi:hypothetical protein